jgi:crotonobetainyl-CoA:carnitine CoA-transferase CaiB-like acyl-CoA transferase
VAGPYAGLLLRQLGADVTKAEPRCGDMTRRWAPPAKDGNGAAYCALNRGKKQLPPGSLDRTRIAGAADAVIVDRSHPMLGGVDADAVVEELVAEGLVVVVLWPMGPGTAREATELELQAAVGLTRYIGAIGEPPVRVGPDVAMTICGVFAAQAVLAALWERQSSGRGQRVDVSGLASMFAVMAVEVAAMGAPDQWEGFHLTAATSPSDFGVPTVDGAISFSAPRRKEAEWAALCCTLGAEELLTDPRFSSPELRGPRAKVLNREMGRYTHGRSMAEVLAAVRDNGGLAVPIQTYRDVFTHPHVLASDLVDRFDGGAMLAAPWRVDGKRPHLTAGHSRDRPEDGAT